eukprot:jgi/Botrbrau1/7970/Bobra.9_2s0121.1
MSRPTAAYHGKASSQTLPTPPHTIPPHFVTLYPTQAPLVWMGANCSVLGSYKSLNVPLNSHASAKPAFRRLLAEISSSGLCGLRALL